MYFRKSSIISNNTIKLPLDNKIGLVYLMPSPPVYSTGLICLAIVAIITTVIINLTKLESGTT